MSNLKRDIEGVLREHIYDYHETCDDSCSKKADYTEVIPELINLIESVVDEDKLWAVKAWFVDSCKHKARTLKDVKLVEYIDYLESKLIGGSNGKE